MNCNLFIWSYFCLNGRKGTYKICLGVDKFQVFLQHAVLCVVNWRGGPEFPKMFGVVEFCTPTLSSCLITCASFLVIVSYKALHWD